MITLGLSTSNNLNKENNRITIKIRPIIASILSNKALLNFFGLSSTTGTGAVSSKESNSLIAWCSSFNNFLSFKSNLSSVKVISRVIIKSSLEALLKRVEFVTYDENKMSGTYVRYPERSELNADINESLIIEFYNR